MTREEAAKWLEQDLAEMKRSTYTCDTKTTESLWAEKTAKKMAIEALREGWIKTADRVPFEEDASDDGLVLALTASRNGKKWRLEGRHWKDLWKVNNPEYWAPLTISLPPLPEVEP